MKRTLNLLASLTALSVAAAWAQSGTQPSVSVVTSIHPYYALVQEIAGENAEVVRMLAPGASPHTFDPSPQDVVQLANADLIILNGVLDEWLTGLVEASGTDAPVLKVMSELTFTPVEEREHEEETEEAAGEEDAHEHEGVNPHLWLDPSLMAQTVPLIAEQLAAVDPEHAAEYRANGETLAGELNALDTELQETLTPLQGAAFVPFHDGWPYFARHYGLELVVEIEPAPGREPSPAYIAEALSLIAGSGAKAVFSEVQLPARPAEVVAESAGLPLYILDPLGGSEETQSYADLMRYNVDTIVTALGTAAQ